MLRHPRRALALLAALVFAGAVSGCGIKGPLVPAPIPDPTKDTAKPAPARP